MNEGRRFIAAILLICGLACAGKAMAEPRIALVVGNGKYDASIGSLINPPNDANLMAERLSGLGFKVTKLLNADQKALKRAISNFGQALQAAGPDAVGLFFYAGHGVQVDGANYLIPVGAAIAAEADVDLEAVSAETVLKQMEFAGARVNIVILDACRNNPLPRSMRSSSRGLARMDAPTGSFIGYSTAPGNVANDGTGKNSPYTSALAAELGKPGIAIEEAFRNVRVKVMASTDAQQVPWESSSLTGAFYFKPGTAATASAAAEPAAASASDAEKGYWEEVKNSQDPGEFDAFLARFPDGFYADLARARSARLHAKTGESVADASRNKKAQPTFETSADTAPATPVAPKSETVPASKTEAETQVASLPPDDVVEAPAPGGTLTLSKKVSGALRAYIAGLQQKNGAFAVSPDGQFFGQFICQEVNQCISGRRGQPQNTNPRYPQETALKKCQSSARQECVLLMVREEKKLPFLVTSQ
ncbi:caspase domain-containing protein [Dongia sp.]|uniref:caspase family protein n=1 Tax=Dongia sp. TaxID=1977262 RepID=UPI0035B2A64F